MWYSQGTQKMRLQLGLKASRHPIKGLPTYGLIMCVGWRRGRRRRRKEGEFIWMGLRVSIQSVTFVFLQKDFSSNMTKHEFCIFRMNMCHFSHSFWNLNTS